MCTCVRVCARARTLTYLEHVAGESCGGAYVAAVHLELVSVADLDDVGGHAVADGVHAPPLRSRVGLLLLSALLSFCGIT